MVEVAVGEEDVVHPGQRGEVEGGGERTGIEGQDPVDEEAGAPAAGQLSTVAAEDLQLHGSPNFHRSSR